MTSTPTPTATNQTNPWLFYGCCRNCNRTPTVAGPFNKDGYCPTCQKRVQTS